MSQPPNTWAGPTEDSNLCIASVFVAVISAVSDGITLATKRYSIWGCNIYDYKAGGHNLSKLLASCGAQHRDFCGQEMHRPIVHDHHPHSVPGVYLRDQDTDSPNIHIVVTILIGGITRGIIFVNVLNV